MARKKKDKQEEKKPYLDIDTRDNIEKYIDNLYVQIKNLNAPHFVKIIFYILAYIILVPIGIAYGGFLTFWLPIRYFLLIFGPIIFVWWIISVLRHIIGYH